MTKRFLSILMLATLVAPAAHSQFFWAEDGIPIRQGLHLGWNGAMQPLGEDVAMFYNDCRRDGTRDLWAQKLAPAGTHLWGENGILVTPHASEQRGPVTAMYPDGTMLLVWEDYVSGRYRDLYAQRYDLNGQALWTPATGVAIIQTAHDQFDPHIAIDASGYAFVVFTDDRESGGGEDTRLGAYAQVISPSGDPVGPADGILLVDRFRGWNRSAGVVAINGNGYAVVTMSTTARQDIVVQKIFPYGEIAWQEDPAVAVTECGAPPVIAAVPGGIAVGYTWCDFPQEQAYVKCVDVELEDMPGWGGDGLLVAEGTPNAAVICLLRMPGNIFKAVSATYDMDINQSEVTLATVSVGGELVGTVSVQNAAAGASPVDLVRANGDTVLLSWVERTDDGSNQTNRLKLAKSWSPSSLQDGLPPDAFVRINKDLRSDLSMPEGGVARFGIVAGRSVERPESLWTVGLTASGQFSGVPEVLGGGVTYDIFDQRTARIEDERLAIVWTDTRHRVERELYLQIMDRFGTPLLEVDGRRLTNSEYPITAAPAIAEDFSGGAYVAWQSYSVSGVYYANVMRVDGDGIPLWTAPTGIATNLGFYGGVFLLSDENGVYLCRTEYNSSFITRVHASRILASGGLAWTPASRELAGPAAYDMSLESAVNDGENGLFLTLATGPWEDTEIKLFHLNEDGTPGTGWQAEGLTFGSAGVRDAFPAVTMIESGVVLTYCRSIDEGAMFSIRATAYSVDGEALWGPLPSNLLGDEPRIYGYHVVPDGQGGFFVGWDDYRETQFARSYAARFDAFGEAVWTQTGIRLCSNENEQEGLAITPDGSGGLWAVWEDQRNSDDYPEFDLFATHIDAAGNPASIGGFTWPSDGYPMCDVRTYARQVSLVPWVRGSAVAVWLDQRSSNPGRCCGAGSVGDIFNNIYAQTLSEISLSGVERDVEPAPAVFGISAIYPNPFNPTATIAFVLSQSAFAKLSVYNTLGEQVAVLLDRPMSAGSHTATFAGSKLSSGVYFARLESGGTVTARKMLLMK